MPFTVRAKITGLEAVLKRLEGLKRSAQKSVVRKAVDAAGKVVLDAIKPLVPKDTGLLARSMGRKVVVGRRSGVALAIVGPRTGFKVTKAVARTSKSLTGFAVNSKTGRVRKVILRAGSGRGPVGRNPTQYAHLVESGRKAVRAKQARALLIGAGDFRASAGPAKGTKFMERGLASARGRVVAAMAAVIDAELIKKAARLAA